MSNVQENGENTPGYGGYIELGKTFGNYQYSIEHVRYDENYDIQDLGFQRRNNYAVYKGQVSYQIFEPNNTFDRYRIRFEAGLEYLNTPNTYSGNDFELDAFFMTSSRFAFGANIESDIGDQYDFYEPRVDGRYFKQAAVFESRAWVSTDYRKKFALDADVNFAVRYNHGDNYYKSFGFSPRYRFTNKFQMIYAIDFGRLLNEKGYVTELEEGDIIFGNRTTKEITNTLSGQLNFNTKSSLTLSFRHYWSPVSYSDQYYSLNEDGTLSNSSYYENNDINYNIWNLDLNYTWQFAPGSFLVALYRNSIFNEDDLSDLNFNENLQNLFEQPINNVVSLKVIYFLDYIQIKSWL